ncbi:MAG TPA: VRR-NUC domain-containing protein [Telluria sp.]|nr:VRR-NUC domain-containing protein [Telluria sp.]
MNRQLDNPFYYLDNFHRVLEWIGTRYADLLAEDELAFLRSFPALPQAARALFVRMVMRKGEVFRASRLQYAEIGCPLAAAGPLLDTAWVEHDPVVSLDELFDLLTKAELAGVFRLSAHERGTRKQEQLEALRAAYGEPRRYSAWRQDGADDTYRIKVKPLCDRLRLIFFGNLRQDWTEFVLSELGIYRFEQVDFSESSRAFRSRRDIDLYLALHACRERFNEGAAIEDVLAQLPPDLSDNDWLRGRHAKLLFQFAQHYEKLRDWPNAYALYRDCRFPGARARAVRVLEKDAQYGAAHQLLAEALAQPESDAERQHLLRIAPRLQRKLGLPKAAAPRARVERMDLNLPMPEDDWWVEGVVRDHLHDDAAPVFYVENTLINGLFGLLCWQAVFLSIPGAFFHPFHHAPADLYSADFYPRRAQAFGACFAQLDSDDYRATIRRNYADKHGIQSPFVTWDYLPEDLLSLALDCIPPLHLRRAFERILADIKANRSGFPDLIQFWPNERRYRMIEVKGPGDRLQDNQLRWIDYCATHDMPVSVCYLQWT